MTYALKPQPFEVEKPRDAKTFQEFCCTVYSEVFRDTSAKEFGRMGQSQHGLDLICRDYVNWVDGQLPKKTIVQCKQTARTKLTYDSVKGDLQRIRALVSAPDSGFADVNRVIFATTAPNCSQLTKRIEQYLEQERPPYVVEVESWDVLSRLVTESPSLSRLFIPSAARPLSSDERTLVGAVYKGLRENNLLSAKVHLENVCPIIPVKGGLRAQLSETNPPHPEVVESLLSIALAADDSRRTVALLEPRLRECHHELALELFRRLRARRRVSGIWPALPGLLHVEPSLSFADELRGLTSVLPRVRGNVHELACLALLFVMEADSEEVATAGFRLISSRLPASQDTQDEKHVHWYQTVLSRFFSSRFQHPNDAEDVQVGNLRAADRAILHKSIKPPRPIADPCLSFLGRGAPSAAFESLRQEYAYPFPRSNLLSFKSNGGYVTRFIASAETLLSIALLGKDVVENLLKTRTLLTTEQEANRILGALARVQNACNRDPSDLQASNHFSGISFLVARLRLTFPNVSSPETVSVLPSYGAKLLGGPERRSGWTVDNATISRVTSPEYAAFAQRQFERLSISAEKVALAALCELALQFRLGLTSFDVHDQLLAVSVGVATVPTPCLMPPLKKSSQSHNAWDYELLPENETFFSLEAFPEGEWGPKWRF
ncbi:hypothetical protein LC612_28290 [Nostoc sp. CHAB 5834]|nr:hypothetical protein [Nostoc sp. CHAB 5834]